MADSKRSTPPPDGRTARTSIAWTMLTVILLTSVVVSGSGVLVAALAFWTDLERQQLTQLEGYIDERGRRNAVLFDTVARVHQTSITRLEQRIGALTDAEAEARFDALFPLRPDGTRRSRDDMFDGYHDRAGNHHYGVAAYLNPPGEISPADRHRLVAAYDVVDSAGQVLFGLIDNIYFFTFANELIISAADRADRLNFYRYGASADFDLMAADFVDLVSPSTNPDRAFICGELSQLISVRDVQSLTTGCFTPYDIDGVPVGAFGTTVQLDAYFEAAMADPPPHGDNLLVDNNGNLIAHPDLIRDRVTEGRVEAIQTRYNLPAIFELLQAQPADQPTGTLVSPDGRWVVAFSRLEGPDWLTLSLVDRNILRSEITAQLAIALGFGIFGVILQGVLAYFILFRRVVRPLAALTRHFSLARPKPAGSNPALQRILDSQHEIGVLARTLETKRIESEDAFDKLESRVAERTRELEAANRSKSAFLANMSHEIRTPLNGILGLAQVLRATSRAKQRQEQARMIQESGETLTQLLNDVLDMSKIEAGRMELAPAPTEPAALLQDLHNLFLAAAAAKEITISLELDTQIPHQLILDPLRVRQCISNLISNAIKFTPIGSVRVSVSWLPRTVSAGLLTVEVADTGIGIEADRMDDLFTPFSQAEAATSGEFGGTGLGLSIARDLARMMGGDLVGRSTPGEGSVFTLTIAAERTGQAEAKLSDRSPDDLADDPLYAPLRGLRLLLVEDNFINRQVARAFLKPLDMQIVETENGAAALDKLADEVFDLVLMDVRMPIMDGLTATRRVRDSEQAWREIPIIALTANASQQDADACFAAGMDSYASKPLKASALYDAMRRGIESRPWRPD